MSYIYSQDPNIKRWTCKETYPGLIKFSGIGKSKEEALRSLLSSKKQINDILFTTYS